MSSNQHRKLRQKSKLHVKLTEAQRAQVVSWLTVENLTYKVVAAKILQEFGLKTSTTSLFEFRESYFSRTPESESLEGAAQSSTQDTILEIVVSIESPGSVRIKILKGKGSQV